MNNSVIEELNKAVAEAKVEEFVQIPAGTYTAKLTGGSLKKLETEGRLSLAYTITEGEYKDQVQYLHVNLKQKSKDGKRTIGAWILKSNLLKSTSLNDGDEIFTKTGFILATSGLKVFADKAVEVTFDITEDVSKTNGKTYYNVRNLAKK